MSPEMPAVLPRMERDLEDQLREAERSIGAMLDRAFASWWAKWEADFLAGPSTEEVVPDHILE